MHNPVTNSGGVLLARVAQIGAALKAKYSNLNVGIQRLLFTMFDTPSSGRHEDHSACLALVSAAVIELC